MPEHPLPDRSRLLVVLAAIQGGIALALYFAGPKPTADMYAVTFMVSVYLLCAPYLLRYAIGLSVKHLRIVTTLTLALGGMVLLFQFLGVLFLLVRVWLSGITHSRLASPGTLEITAVLFTFSLACATCTIVLSVCRRARQGAVSADAEEAPLIP